MLSAHYFYILSCSVYVSRGLINYNLLCRQQEKNTLLEGMYFCSIIFVNIFGGGELPFLSTSKAGCCRFLCKRLGKPKASTFICPLLVTLISILFSSGLELNLGGKEEPLLAAASALRAHGTGWCFLQGKMAQWEAARSISHPSAAPRQRAQLPAHLCCTYDVFCASEVICPCP